MSLVAVMASGILVTPIAPVASANPAVAARTPDHDASSPKATPPEPVPALGGMRSLARPSLENAPLQFEPNVGQVPSDITFFARLGTDRLVFTSEGAVYQLRSADTRVPKTASRQAFMGQASRTEQVIAKMKGLRRAKKDGDVRMELVGRLPSAPVAEHQLRTVVHYYVGQDPRQWHTNVPTFASIRQRNVYPGIDVVHYGKGKRTEYDFVVAPGADPRQIRIAFRGADTPTLAANGDLRLTVNGRTIHHRQPDIYQELAGERRAVPGRYVVAKNGEVGFELGAYDRKLALVIDPQVLDLGNGVSGVAEAAVGDSNGITYMVGTTASPAATNTNTNLCSLPFVSDTATDAFVAKLPAPDAQGVVGAPLWVAILGGRETGNAAAGDCSASLATTVALDATAANVFIGGSTNSPNFVVTPPTGGSVAFPTSTPTNPPFQRNLGDDSCYIYYVESSNNFYAAAGDGFVLKLTAAGAFVFGTYIGGNLLDMVLSITVDSAGFSYVTGSSQSQTIASQPAACSGGPAVPVFPTQYANLVDTTAAGGGIADVMLAKLSATGSVVNFLTLQGGSGIDEGVGIVISAQNEIIVTANAYSEELLGASLPSGERFAAVEPSMSLPLAAVTEGFSQCFGLKVDFKMSATEGASTQPFGMRVKKTNVPGDATANCTDVSNGIIAKFANPAATVVGPVPPLANGTYYVGGSDADTSAGIAIDQAGNIYVAGQTLSGNFPSKNPVATPDPNNPTQLIVDPAAQIVAQNQVADAPALPTAAAYVLKLTLPAGTTTATDTNMAFSSPLGGVTGDTSPTGIAVSPGGTVFVSGMTNATDTNVLPAAPVDNGTMAYVLAIPPPATPTAAPTVTTDNQIALGVIDPAAPPAMKISVDVDGNVTVAGAPAADGSGTSLGAQIKATIDALIDIKPKAKKNNINLKTRYVQVAILSDSTFNAVDRIDQTTVTFGKTGDEQSLVKCDKKGRKVSKKDKIYDLVCTFRVSKTGFAVGDTTGTLKAKTKAQADVVGVDSIYVVPPKKHDRDQDFDDDDDTWDDSDDRRRYDRDDRGHERHDRWGGRHW
jgi:hypothetical protein